jgi:peptide/nickel transport system substrate-binding protein
MQRSWRVGEAEWAMRSWIDEVRDGRMARRELVARAGAIGLTLPMAGLMLMEAGWSRAAEPSADRPNRRGGSGTLKLLEWQMATRLNPHLGGGLRNSFAARIFYEPLADWDADANLQPVLAAEIPSRENGGVSADGRHVVWRLKKGVMWHDGAPFTADDVVFNREYAVEAGHSTATSVVYEKLRFEKIDSHTVLAVFERPAPFWPGLYTNLPLIPRHVFARAMGERKMDTHHNVEPVGTGPFRLVEFRPGDLLRAELFAGYHRPNRPHFDRLEVKGGGESVSAARAVLQTGDYDYAGSLAVDDEVLRRMESGGKGRVEFTFGSTAIALHLNATDPEVEVNGERSHPSTRHPLWSDPAVRRAMGLLVDRENVQAYIHGRSGEATANWIHQPARYRSTAITTEFSVEKAAQLLGRAGWKLGPDGVREKDGRKLAVRFDGPAGGTTQKLQSIVKAAAEKAGFRVEIRATAPSVFFASGVANADSFRRFAADMLIFPATSFNPDPQSLAQCFVSWEIPGKANQWIGQNVVRWHSDEYDALYRLAELELDAVKRAALFVRMNELIAAGGHVLPVIAGATVRAIGSRLRVPLSAWRLDTASLADWYREG